MANEVELITFANKTVSPVYDAIIQELYTDGGGVITGCTVTIKDANHLHITEGYGVLCGREFKIVASDIPVQLSSSGNLNGRLYLHMDLSLATDPITLLVETGSTLTPVQQDANVNTTNGVYEVNLATFTVGTSAISNLQDVAPQAVKIPEALNTLNSNLGKWELLCSSQATTQTEVNLAYPLSDYKSVALVLKYGGNQIFASTVIPVALFKAEGGNGLFTSLNNGTFINTRAYYKNSDTKIDMLCAGLSGITGAFYGIK